MATIVRLTLEIERSGGDRWDAIAAAVTGWAGAHGIALRDAIVLLPFAQLLAPARRAFARAGGWMPRIETTRTLAAGLGPPVPAAAGELSFDPTADALSAAALLRTRPWGAAWARRDPRGFDQAADRLVATAHALTRSAFALAPAERANYWERARAELAPHGGPGATERLLARIGLEWAALTPAPATDRLRALAPAAWIAVQAGGADALTQRLLAQAAVPALVVDTDASADDPYAAVDPLHPPAFGVCDGFEHEAQCAAAQVIEHLRRGEHPVALIAQDRALVRRVRALLDRQPLQLLDETGWKLSTTRAAAQLMSLLRAAPADASSDAVIDWLKAGPGATHDAELRAFEAECRRRRLTRVDALDRAELGPAAARLWARAKATLRMLRPTLRRPLPSWLDDLHAALAESGALAALQRDDAGRQVLAALRLGSRSGAPAASGPPAELSHGEFAAWIDQVFERASYVPTTAFEAPVDVVITPLARAMLRPFAAIVFPGADDRHLGAAPMSAGLIDDVQAAALGLPTAAQTRAAELCAFAQALAAPGITLLRRRSDGAEPLVDSPLVERLALALAQRGAVLARWSDPRPERRIEPTPIAMSAPAAPQLLPARLSASACEALRACPYRFYVLRMLRLREDDELEREVEKRDYGTWLHALLFEFHRGRGAPAAPAIELARLHALAGADEASSGIGAADFLPYAASFASFAPRYIAWLHERDRAGARWLHGEHELSARPEGFDGIELHGIIDRVDAVHRRDGEAIELIDYKTGSASKLKEQVRQPLEDTQLAFYAALMGAHSDAPLHALYLALDGSKRLDEIPHLDVGASAAALVAGLAHDLRRLRAGAGLPALGAGATCDYCAARGVCRRDHWDSDLAAAAGAT